MGLQKNFFLALGGFLNRKERCSTRFSVEGCQQPRTISRRSSMMSTRTPNRWRPSGEQLQRRPRLKRGSRDLAWMEPGSPWQRLYGWQMIGKFLGSTRFCKQLEDTQLLLLRITTCSRGSGKETGWFQFISLEIKEKGS